MSQGGSRRPYSRGGPRWHPRYKEYWDYEQNYSDGSSAGSPKEACVANSPPPAPAKRDVRHHHDQRRLSIGGGGAGGSRRAERRAAGTSDRRRPDLRVSPGAGAGPSVEPPHMLHPPHHHHLDTNPLEGPVESMVSGGGSSDGELSSKAGDSPSRKRRRISRHLSSGESNVSVTAPAVERRTPRHHYQPPRRMRYVSGGGGRGAAWAHERLLEPHAHQHPHPHPHAHPHPHHAPHAHVHPAHAHAPHPAHPAHSAPVLLDINQMSLRGARLSALGGGGVWPHPHPHPHPAHSHPHRDHAPRTQMGGVYAGLQYHGGFAPHAPRGPFASPPHAPHPHHAHPHHHTHYIANSQRAEGGRLEMLSGGEGTLSPLQATPDLHHAPLLLTTEARGSPLELMAPHHARHALSHHHHRVRRGRGLGRGRGCGRGRGRGGVGVARGAALRAPRAALAAPHDTPHTRADRRRAGGRGAAAAARGVAAVAAAAAAHLPGVPEPAGHVPGVPVRGGSRGGGRVAGDGELRGAAVPRREARGGQAEGPRPPGDRAAAQLQVLAADAPGRAVDVRGVHVRVRGAADAARAAVRARVPRQVRRQVAEVEPNVSNLPRERVRVLQQLRVTQRPASVASVASRAARAARARPAPAPCASRVPRVPRPRLAARARAETGRAAAAPPAAVRAIIHVQTQRSTAPRGDGDDSDGICGMSMPQTQDSTQMYRGTRICL